MAAMNDSTGDIRVGETLVRVEGLSKYFSNDSGFLDPLKLERNGSGLPKPVYRRDWVRAVDNVSFDIKRGETLGLVGESGCGKSTLARTIIKLLEPTDGDVYFKGNNLADLSGARLRTMRRDMQIIFQDPQSSLDPRMKIGLSIEEPMKAHGLPESDPSVATSANLINETGYEVSVDVANDIDMIVEPSDGVATVDVTVVETDDGALADTDSEFIGAEATLNETTGEIQVSVAVTASKADLRRARARDLLGRVGLDPQHYNRYPHQFSGGQRQRVNLARALSVDPDFIVCDEPTSALDASIQAQVLNTMNELQDEFGLTYLFISHDLSVIRHIADRVAVMYLGEIVELADKEELFENPQHPYTEALLSAIPVPDPHSTETRSLLEGEVPSPINPPSGCRFRTRCPKLIAPPEYDMTDEEWKEVRQFTRATDRRVPEVTAITARRELREEFFDAGPPSGKAGEIVEQALDEVVAGDVGEAAERLRERFADRSICAREAPSYEVEPEYGTAAHRADCHRNQS